MEQAVHTPPLPPETTRDIHAKVFTAPPEPQVMHDPNVAPAPKEGAGAAGVFGAILSVSLVLGLGVWGYKLAVRDVSGVPVVRALEGPMRIQPDDPGGESAAYQGYSVNTVQARGGVETPADTLALAPRSIGLKPEDGPVSPSTEVSPLSSAEAVVPETPAVIGDVPASDAAAQMLALADQLTEGVAPLSGELTDITPTSSGGVAATQAAANSAVAAALLDQHVIPTSVPGVSRSPRPNPRPADLAILNQTSVGGEPPAGTAIAALARVQEIAAADIPAGTRLVQLGAFDSAEVARGEWDQLMGEFGDYLEGKIRVIHEASSGGKTFYRLRAHGFTDLADTRRFCTVLIAGNALCIPVMTR